MILEFDGDLNMRKRIVLGWILYGLGSLFFSDLPLDRKAHTPEELSVAVGLGQNLPFATIASE